MILQYDEDYDNIELGDEYNMINYYFDSYIMYYYF